MMGRMGRIHASADVRDTILSTMGRWEMDIQNKEMQMDEPDRVHSRVVTNRFGFRKTKAGFGETERNPFFK